MCDLEINVLLINLLIIRSSGGSNNYNFKVVIDVNDILRFLQL